MVKERDFEGSDLDPATGSREENSRVFLTDARFNFRPVLGLMSFVLVAVVTLKKVFEG